MYLLVLHIKENLTTEYKMNTTILFSFLSDSIYRQEKFSYFRANYVICKENLLRKF